MKPIGIMHLTDTLDAGGLERVAVNLVNLLPRGDYTPHLCTTRREGTLADLIKPDVGRLAFNRRWRFECSSLRRLSIYNREHGIAIMHSHGTALLVAVLASFLPPFPKVVWHDHYGDYAIDERPVFPYWLLTRRVSMILAVNQPLVEWAQKRLGVNEQKVQYLANFVCSEVLSGTPTELPGKPGLRIVCVANLRPRKDHLTLIRAMAGVVSAVPGATLLLLGATNDQLQLRKVKNEIARLNLSNNIHILGSRQNVAEILRECDVGVLSSASEGLPLSLIEYGMAGLASVATAVGQCADVLDGGRVGLLVQPGNELSLAAALVSLLRSSSFRKSQGEQFRSHVMKHYSASTAIAQLCKTYERILS
jgi:glycosyltransferase involved in cell wall biosynthesis